MANYTGTGQGRGRGILGSGGDVGSDTNTKTALIADRSYSTVPGYFEHDEKSQSYEQTALPSLDELIHDDVLNPRTKATWAEPLPSHFGLKKSSWAELIQDLHNLIKNAPPNVSYKLLFLGRHGQADNNIGKVNELDTELTWEGRTQAKAVHDLWDHEIGEGIPVPHTLYCSPLRRTMETCGITFNRLRQGIDTELQFRRVLLEDLRELNGQYLCDKRRPHSYLRFLYEETYTDEDTLWTESHETHEHLRLRVKKVLNHIFSTNSENVISITSHSGTLHALLNVINHPHVSIPTGGVVATVVMCITDIVEATYQVQLDGGVEVGEYLPRNS